MATGTSKMLLPEPFTGSNDIESYITHFELLANLQNWRRTVTREGNEVEVDDRPHYFALRLQKSAIDFYRTLTDEQKGNYENLKQAFRTHYTEKPVVFRGRLARRVQHPGEKLTDFLGDLQCLAMKAYPGESKEIRDHLVVRGFLEGIRSSQVRLDMRKTVGDAEMNIERLLETALHFEAVTRIEEEDKEPRVAMLQPDKNDKLIESVNQLVEALTVSRDSRSDNRKGFHERNQTRSSSRESTRNKTRGRPGRGRGYQRGRNYRPPTPGKSPTKQHRSLSREKVSETDREVGFDNDSCHKCGQKGHWARDCRNCYNCGSSQHYQRECPFLN